MLKRFFSRLRSSKKATPKRKSNKKITYFWQSRKGKIGIGISAVILLVAVILFSSQIDNLLRLWGIKANEMGTVTLSVEPITADVYPNEPLLTLRTAEYDIIIDPQQGVDGELWLDPSAVIGDGQVGLENITVNKIVLIRWPISIDPYISSLTLKKEGSLVEFNYDRTNSWFDLSADPLVFHYLDPEPNLAKTVHLTFVTEADPPLLSNLTGNFDVGVEGSFTERRVGGEHGTGFLSYTPAPLTFILNFIAGEPPVGGDFSVTILEPDEQTITAGNPAEYTIEVAPVGNFAGTITVFLGHDIDYPSEAISDVTMDYSPHSPPLTLRFDSDPIPVKLTVETISTLDHPVPINFIITGIGQDQDGNTLPPRSDNGILNIEPNWDFTIATTLLESSAQLEDIRVVPGGSITYEIAVTRTNGWDGAIQIPDTWSADPNLNDKIESITFPDLINRTFVESTEPAETEMIIVFKDDAPASDQIITFSIEGKGDLNKDGDTDDPLETKTADVSFEVISFNITVEPIDTGDGFDGVVQALEARTVVYQVTLRPENNSRWPGFIHLDTNLLFNPDYPTEVRDPEWTEDISAFWFDDPVCVSISASGSWETNLSITTTNLIDPPDILFKVIGRTGAVGVPTGTEMYLADYTTFFSRTGDGLLRISADDNFSIFLTYKESTAHQNDKAVPGGTITYDVTLYRWDGWVGAVTLSNDIANNWLEQIEYAEFANGLETFTFTNTSAPREVTTLEIKIWDGLTEAQVIDIENFEVVGTYDAVDPDPDIIRSAFETFSIIDFSIEVELTDLTVEHHWDDGVPTYVLYPNQADTIRIYQVTIHPINNFSGKVTLSYAENNNLDVPTWNDVVGTITWDNPDSDASKSTLVVDGFDVVTSITMSILDFTQEPVGDFRNLDFTIWGEDTVKTLVDGTTKLYRDDIGRLQIKGTPIAPDFSIALAFESSTSDIANTAVPYGTITYRITATRFGGWNGAITLRTEDLIRFNGAIVSATFTNGGRIEPLPAVQTADLTLEINELASAIEIRNFTVYGDGMVNSVLVTHSAMTTFNIIDFTITVTAQPPHWGSTPAWQVHDDITYLITINPLNNYTGTVNLTSNLNLWSASDIDMTGTWFEPVSIVMPATTSILHIKTLPTISGPQDIYFTVTGTDPNKTTIDSTNFYNEGTGRLTVTDLLPSPNFSIEVTPNPTLNMIWNSEDHFNVKVTPLNGFVGSIYLGHDILITPEITYAVLGLPPIGHLDFTDATPQTIPLTVRTGNLSGAYLTMDYYVTGTGYYYDIPTNLIPGISNAFNIKVNDAPTFRITVAPPYQSVYPNGSRDYNVTLARQNGFIGDVRLTTDAIAISGGRIVNATFLNSSFLPSDTLTYASGETTRILRLTVDNQEIAGGPYNFTVTSSDITGPWGNRTAQAQLEILLTPIFTIEVIPNYSDDNQWHTTTPGGPAVSYNVFIRTVSSFVGVVNLTHNLPMPTPISSAIFGATQVTFVAGDTEKSTTLSVSAASGIPDQNVDFFVTGNGNVRSNDARLEITNQKDFTLSMEPEKSVFPGGSANYIVTLHRLNFFAGEVTTSAQVDLPALINLPIVIENNGVFIGGGTADQTLILTITSRVTAPSRDVLITVSGTSADIPGIIKETSGILHIFNFRISIREDSQDVIRGQSAIYTIDLIRENGFNRTITLRTTDLIGNPNIDGIPSFTNGGTFPAGTGNGSTALTINTVPTAALTTIKFAVIGTDAVSSEERNDSANLNIIDNNPGTPDFRIVVTPDSQTVEPGGSTSYTITITKLNGFDEIIILSTDLKTDNPDEILRTVFVADPFNPGVVTLTVFTTEVRNSEDPITFSVFGTTTALPPIERSDSADLIIYKAGGGGGGGTVIPPVVPPATPPTPPVTPPVEEPEVPEVEIPETLPSTGPDIWMWLIALLLLSSIGFQELDTKRPK